jgi:MerR family mercuric resistance operon transcriptional regulator
MTVDVGEGLRSGALARAAGVNEQTLRYYERRGLLMPAARTLGGHRLYSPDAVTVLRVIKAAQRLGFSLDEIAELIEVGRHHHGTADAGLQARAGEKLREVESRIADLQEIRATLRAAIDAGCDDLLQCAGSDCCPLPFEAVAVPLTARKAGGPGHRR